MYRIFPKTSETLDGIDKFKNIIDKHHGLEIQFFEHVGRLETCYFRKVARRVKEIYPSLEEITIHPPLEGHDIEMILLKDKNIFYDEVKQAVKLSKEINVHINLLYHC